MYFVTVHHWIRSYAAGDILWYLLSDIHLILLYFPPVRSFENMSTAVVDLNVQSIGKTWDHHALPMIYMPYSV